MGKREDYATRILNDFSQQITPELYWKIYIFAYCLNNTPKIIKRKMETELEKISIEKYPKLDIDSLRKEYDKYNKKNNEKINTLKKYRRICDLPNLLHIAQLDKIFKEAFPSPYSAGFIESNWTPELKEAVKKYYFDSPVLKLHISKALTDTDLLEYYLSHPYYDFFYVHLQIAEYEPKIIGFDYKAERRYNRTYVAMLLHYTKGDGSGNHHIKILKSNQGGYAYDNDYFYHLDEILSPLIENTHTNKRPLLFIYNPHKILQENFILNTTQPRNYSLYCFEDFSTILPIIQKYDNLFKFLSIMEKCARNASEINFKFITDIKNSNQNFKEMICDAFIEKIRSEEKNN